MTVARDPRPGSKRSRLGRYELVARIAAGGMAEVYVARVRGEGGFERLVAIKRMLPNIAEDERFAEMFLDEGRISGHIESPNVVQIMDVGRDETDGTLFIAMEFVRGAALHRLLSAVARAGEHVPVPIAAAIVAQAADGLAAAHDATTPIGEPLHIVHRDVSPQNVLCGIDGRIRVADFGIARAVHRKSNTSTGELKGKLAYFAPEQLRAQQADPRSDVFSLGVVAWEVFAQRRLFQGEHPLETMERIRAHDPEPLDAIRSDVPPGLGLAIARALAKEPTQRTQSARALAAEIRESCAVADGAAVAAFVRRFADEGVRALDEQIKAALTGAKTAAIPLPAIIADGDASGIVQTQAIEEPTLVTPSASISLPGLRPRVPPPPPRVSAPAAASSPGGSTDVRSETSMNLGLTAASESAPRPYVLGGIAIAGVLLLVLLAIAWSFGGASSGPVATELPVARPASVPTAAPPAPPSAVVAPLPGVLAAPPSTDVVRVAPAGAAADEDDSATASVAPRGREVRREPRPPSTATSVAPSGTAPRTDTAPRTPATGRSVEPERRGGLRGRDSFLGEIED